jgi:hypothetical protein
MPILKAILRFGSVQVEDLDKTHPEPRHGVHVL